MNTSQHIHYDHYSAEQIKRLDGFYGLVEEKLHEELLPYIQGKSILDIGCGFGSLCNFFHEKGYAVTGIEQHAISLDAAKKKFPNLNLLFDEGNLLDTIPEKAFDVIILKDVIHHVVAESNVESFMKNLHRICKKSVIIIDPNPTFTLRLSRKLIKHIDPECPPNQALEILKHSGFQIKKLLFSEVLAFPLSGGYVGPELIKSRFLMNFLLKIDRLFKKIFDFFRVSRLVCWRYVLIAEK